MKPNILNVEPEEYSQTAINTLKSVANYYEKQSDIEVHGIITRLRHKLDSDFLSKYPDLKYILSATTGLDHIDQELCNRLGIKIISLRGETEFLNSITATAEHTITLMLALLRNIPTATSHVRKGHWNRMEHKGNELKNKTLCILGIGRLGTQVARIASAFQMKIQCFDKHVSEEYWTTTNLYEALTGADIVSVHLPYDSDTHHLLTVDSIMKTNPSAYIINTSRGQIIKEEDLVKCLANRHLAGVAVDVLEDEFNISKSPLVKYSSEHTNVLITPHIGGCTYESMENTEVFIAQKFKQLLRLQQ